ncbi:hypothetical protein [Methyloceanibacter methanicus]|uniref:hypothetical protein n=1 Tax=Methyloceanibacter methanicus TaxID=1774968 RepID=UPI00195873BD|nr:hypothetical protein [Methyloceanibacter methanicus]
MVLATDGSYADFDRGSPLTRPGGKAQICRALSEPGRTVALVGDGATDLEARGAGVFVVGFGGVVVRGNVVAGADVFVPGPALTAVLGPLLP